MAKRDLAGKVAWVTGGGTGIGQAAAGKLVDAGCHLILTGEALGGVSQSIARCRRVGESFGAGRVGR